MMADMVGDNRPHLIITMGGHNGVVDELADSVSGNRPRVKITARGPIRTVTHRQSGRGQISSSARYGEIISSRQIHEVSTSDIITRTWVSRHSASSTSYTSANIRHHHLHLLALLRRLQSHRVLLHHVCFLGKVYVVIFFLDFYGTQIHLPITSFFSKVSTSNNQQ